jgi:hypothetical protein
MQKRFLINADGTVPASAPVAALEAAGVILVVPTPVPTPPEGQVVVEADAVQDGDVWRQVWELVPAPEPEPEEAPVPSLTRPQFVFLLRRNGLAQIWTAVEAQAEIADPELYALLGALRERDTFRFETTVAMIATFAPFLPEGVTLDADTLLPMWLQAAAADI